MVLSKRERVFRTLELDGEPDMIPIFNTGYEPTSSYFQEYYKSNERKQYIMSVKSPVSKKKYDITMQRFFNSDIHNLDPFGEKLKPHDRVAPSEYPDCYINTISGKVEKTVKQVETGLDYLWYIDGHFKTPEILRSYWDKYGKPSELINERINYSPKIWEGFVESLSQYFYPMALLPLTLHESLFEGMTISRVAYYMRKNPQFIHDVLFEYTKVNVEIIKRFGEAGVDVAFMGDDLGYKGQTIFSLINLREFLVPCYKKIYTACKKNGMLVVHHSCGNISGILPDLIDAGLNCIQSLEPASGVDLAHLKATLGDKVCFMGGLDASNVLNFGTPKDVEEEVKRCFKAAGYGGGYFTGPSHDILNMPWENVLAMRAAIEKYRKYPLNLS